MSRVDRLNFDVFQESVLRELGLIEGAGSVTVETGLWDDLGLDSFDGVRLVILVENMSRIFVPDIPLPELFTMGDAFNYYVALAERAREQEAELK
jgi:acyl carrier protein